MKVLLVVVAVLAAAYAEKPLRILSVEETTAFDYHNRVGEPEAKRIQAEELQLVEDPSRIVGGGPASTTQHPYMGGLVITLTTGGTSVCSSSLVSNNRVLTAAHCWWDGRSQARQFVVVLGTTSLFTGGTRITTTNVQMHGSWNPNNLSNDVAVAVINSVSIGNTIRHVGLATGTATYAGTWGWASGYGVQSGSTGIGTNQQRHRVQLQVITNAVCQQSYGSSVIASTICTGGAGGIGTCGGDSGGPFTINNGQTLVGVTSFGATNCQAGHPSAYARVTSFATWIQQRL